jgi:hypothetical protein
MKTNRKINSRMLEITKDLRQKGFNSEVTKILRDVELDVDDHLFETRITLISAFKDKIQSLNPY